MEKKYIILIIILLVAIISIMFFLVKNTSNIVKDTLYKSKLNVPQSYSLIDLSTNTIDGKEEKVYGKKISNYNNVIMISDTDVYGSWFPEKHPLKDYKNITIEVQIEDKNTGRNYSLIGNGLVPRYYGASFDINITYPGLIKFKDGLKPELNWKYATNYQTKYINKSFVSNEETKYLETENEEEMNVTKEITYTEVIIKQKEYSDYMKIDKINDFVSANLKTSSSLDPDVSECGTLNTADSTYTLTQSVNSSGTCFNIMANNVTLDCAGFMINYSQGGILGHGVYVGGYNLSTIKNCMIKEGASGTSSKYAINLNRANNGTIENNSIVTIAGSSYGVFLTNSHNNAIRDNIINTSGSTYIVRVYSDGNRNISS